MVIDCVGLGHSYSRAKVKFNVHRSDNMIIQSISLLDQLDKDINTFAMRIRCERLYTVLTMLLLWYYHHGVLFFSTNKNYEHPTSSRKRKNCAFVQLIFVLVIFLLHLKLWLSNFMRLVYPENKINCAQNFKR